MLYCIIRWIALIFFKLFLWFRVKGSENVPVKGGFIIAANHSSSLDPPLLAVSIRRSIHFIMRDMLLYFPVLGFVLKNCKTIPMKRHGLDLGAIKSALRVCEQGGVLGIFPEGTRTKDRKLKRAKPGIGMLAYKTKVPVVPAYIEGAFDVLPRRPKTFKRHPVRIYIGKPIYFTKECAEEQNRETYQLISDEIMRQIAVLKPKADS